MAGIDLSVAIPRLVAERPRLAGLLLIVLSGSLVGWNSYCEHSDGVVAGYYPSAYLLCYPALAAGAWMLVTGRSASDGRPHALRWGLGTLAALLLGLAYGIYCLRQAHP